MFTGIELYEGKKLPGVGEAFTCVQIELEQGCGSAEDRSHALRVFWTQAPMILYHLDISETFKSLHFHFAFLYVSEEENTIHACS